MGEILILNEGLLCTKLQHFQIITSSQNMPKEITYSESSVLIQSSKSQETDEHSCEDMPPQWQPPPRPIARRCFIILCYIFVADSNLESFWKRISRDSSKGWKDYHAEYFEFLNRISTVQGLLLTTTAVFISTAAPLSILNYAADIPYACLSESLVFALFGLFLQLFVSAYLGPRYKRAKTLEELEEKRWMIFCHLFNLALPALFFNASLGWLLKAIVITGCMSQSLLTRILTIITVFARVLVEFLSFVILPPFRKFWAASLWGIHHDRH
ncbi:uncharacterized protein F5147DRAFT_357605 [Suillus discolor]|uniref:Uncharacterized protein n=1 Tax=Suillus discolor TaxID=1912936 RepID=A0A9P7F0W8_9AGAM|nr:uncharacterized protein F5147DRAFT_357605 [Suillus discolor]KAG2098761.1 hypothetical protein F5147DRAFT_357605 [Suillus discolor]